MRVDGVKEICRIDQLWNVSARHHRAFGGEALSPRLQCGSEDGMVARWIEKKSISERFACIETGLSL
jgi:hypothetical protein